MGGAKGAWYTFFNRPLTRSATTCGQTLGASPTTTASKCGNSSCGKVEA
ncbi:MAG: hypothetical protein HYT81_04595 [Gemmatimonadetes bacterium]|nr:hypothetical protein [Gemmatimonadota bacterium]